MPRKYRLKENTTHLTVDNLQKGDVVYHCSKPSYGLCTDDERHFKYEFTFVTHNENGDYPALTCPTHLLEEIKD